MGASAGTDAGTGTTTIGGTTVPASSRWRASARLRGPSGQDQEGRLWEITLIRAGVSKNGKRYSEATLREAVEAGVFDGVIVNDFFFDGKHKHVPISVLEQLPEGVSRNRIGQVIPGSVRWDEPAKEIIGILAVDDQRTRDRWLNTYKRGGLGNGDADLDVEGFSIDTRGRESAPDEAGIKDVLRIIRAVSLDSVTNPAAQGRIRRLVADTDTPDDPPNQPPAGQRQEETVSAEALKKLEEQLVAQKAEMATLREEVKETRQLAAMDDDVQRIMQWAQALATAEGEERAQILKDLAEFTASLVGAPAVAAQTEASKVQMQTLEALLNEDRIKEDVETSDRLRSVIAALREDSEPPSPEAAKLASALNMLRDQALDHAAQREGTELGFHDYREALALADLAGVKVGDDGLTVTGLREAFEACKKARPHLCSQQEAAPPAAGSPAPATPATPAAATPAAAGVAAAGKPAPRGQDVPQRESGDDDPASIQQTAARLLLRATRYRDVEALKQYDKLRRSGALGTTA